MKLKLKEKKRYIAIIAVLLIVFVIAAAGIKKESEWSIGIYTGEDVFDLEPYEGNPALTGEDVNDIQADFVADPFIVKDDKWYMFFEVLNSETGQGDIGLAVSEDGIEWEYEQIVLDEVFHLSYPYVFKFEDSYYMIPENGGNSVKLYVAENFPFEWEFIGDIIEGYYADPSIFRYDDRWWLFASDLGNNLYLYHSDDLAEGWQEHPDSPVVVNDENIARSAGRVLVGENIIRFAQDGRITYGNNVRGFEVELDEFNYEEMEIGIILKADKGWSSKGMHHIDLKDGIAAVDGVRTKMKLFGFDCWLLSEIHDIMIRTANSIF